MKVGSLFAGIGGFDLAAERAGMEVAWQSEVDVHASRVLDHHWPGVKNLGDIHEIRPHTGVDVLCGGFPCQDYSVAGRRGGLAADRGALWWEFHRLISELNPTWIIGENVPGLLSSRDGRDFATIIGSLVELGYGVTWRVLDAQFFGVAQRRRRVFIVGHSGGIPRPEVLALGQSVSGDTPPLRKTRPGATASVSTSLKASGKIDHVGDESKLITLPGAPPLTARSYKSLNLEGSEDAWVAFNWQSGQGQLSARTSHTDALLAGQVPAISAETVRRLTPLECERLQGFPDGWTDIPGNSDTQRYRQLGNAVAVPVVEWIMRRIGAV